MRPGSEGESDAGDGCRWDNLDIDHSAIRANLVAGGGAVTRLTFLTQGQGGHKPANNWGEVRTGVLEAMSDRHDVETNCSLKKISCHSKDPFVQEKSCRKS